MPNARVDFPISMALPELFHFVRELDFYSQHDRVIIELPERIFMPPFAQVLLASKIKYMRQRCPDLSIIFNGWENYGYLSHMGFFDMCGFEHGRKVGEAAGSTNYLPITEVHRASFYETKLDEYEELPDLIQRHVDRISEILARDRSANTNMFDILSYSIREMFRNVFEHGETDRLYFCAQYWPRSNKVEFAVSDFGVGIRQALGNNPNFRFKTDKEALEYSLLPSVSGRTHEPRRSENWFNSGYGLYMTNRLARNGGNFVIASGSDAIHLSRRSKHNYLTSFPGTAIRVNLNVDEIGAVQARLEEFRKEGFEIASKITGSGNRPPSAMSLLLRRDYQTGIHGGGQRSKGD